MRGLIIGWGSIGRRHAECLRAVAPDCELVVWRQQAVDTVASRAAVDIAAQVIFSAEAAISSAPDFAIVANPAPHHVPTARILMQHSIPMLIEKPLACDMQDVALLRSDLQERHVPLMVGYVLRFHPALIQTKALLQDNSIGRPLHARLFVGQHLADWRTTADWQNGISARRAAGGGALLELSHEIDLAFWLFGTPSGVVARIAPSSLPGIDAEDNTDLLLDLPDGMVVNIHLDMISRPARRVIEILGTDGAIQVDLISGKIALWQNAHPERGAAPAIHAVERNYIYQQQLQHFLDCLHTGRPPCIDFEAGAAIVGAIEAARRSAVEGRRISL